MAKKSSPRKSLKSLFSKSEANLDESVEKDANKHEGEKKKFKLFKFKTKAKSDSASEKSAGGSQLVLSANEPNNTAEDGDAWPDITVSANKKKSSFFGTTPRSKGREFSYSELDLRKPSRKFATFSLGLRKKKKRDDDNISKSTFGLHSPGIEEQEETPLDLSQMESDQTNTKKMFSMSQPELDTSDTFDIPSPPPVAANQSYFTTSQSQLFVATNMQPESKESLTGSNLSDVGVCSETPKAPIASIPELLLDDENAHILVYDNSSRSEDKSPVPATHIETISVVDNQTAPRPSASQPPNVLDTSIYKACDNDIFQQPDTKSEISLTKSTSPTLSNHQPPVPDRADRMTTSDEPSLTSVGSKTDATIAESACVSHCANDNSALSSDSAAIHEDISISCTERSVPEAAKSVTASSTVNSEKSLRPHSEDVVYGALYDSLLPKSFISELMSSLLNPPTQICSETTYLKARSEPVMVKTLDEWQTETNVMYSCVSSSQDISASKENDTENSIPNNFKVASTSENSSFNSQHHSSTSLQTDMDVHHKYLPTSLSSATESAGNHVPDSELTRPHSQIKSKSISPIHNTVGSLPVVQNSAPPISECMMSHGTNTQVTGSKRRVILVKQLDTDEGNAVSGYHSWASRKMSATNSPEMKNDTTDFFYVASGSGLSDGSERPLSPPYLSMGSDDGSIMEVYYSAQEDNTEESGEEEMNTTNERQDICVVDDVREMEWREIEETGKGSKDKGSLGIVIVKMEKEGGKIGKEEKNEDPNSQTEVQQQQGGQMAEAQVHQAQVSDFLTSSDANNPEEETTTTALPQMKEEGEERRMEELVATPVQQVNTVMVCEVVPPSSEPHRQGEGSEENWTEHLKRQDHLIGDQEIQYQNLKEIRSSEYEQTAFINAPEVNVIEPTWGQAKEQIQLTADKREEPSKESTETDSKATTRAVTDAELQLDATEIEHNRTLQSSGWVDTITQSTDKERRVQEQVAVELSTLNAETHRSNTDPAEPERHEHPTGAHPDSDRGSPTVSGSNIAAFEVFASESQQTNTDQELLDKMSSGYSSLSTRLTLRNISPPEEDDSKFQNRFHKMSLITEVDGLRKDTEDSNTTRSVTTVTESNGTNIEPGYRWRNKFEGVTQYKQQTSEDSSSDSLSYSVSDTYSSTSTLSSSGFPEATAYKPLSDTYSSPTLGDRLRTAVYVSHESEPAAEQKDEWRRSLVIQEEPSAPAGEREGQREGEAESVRIQSRWDTQQHPVSSFSSTFQTGQTEALKEGDNNESTEFSGLFKATLVELVSDPAAPPSTPPASPDAESSSQFEMDSLVDTLKSMGPAHRPRSMGLRPHTQTISSLPPIDEDAFSPATSDGPGSLTSPSKTGTVNGFCSLPADLGLGRNTNRDSRSPLQLMKQGLQEQQLQPGTRGLNMPLRASATSSIVMKTSSDTTEVLNGNGVVPNTGSRLDNSVIFGSYRPLSIDQSMENGKTHRSVFRTSSLPETGLSNDRISKPKEPGDVAGSRFDRFSFLLNSSSSSSGSLTGVDDPRMSRAPSLGMTSPPSSNSPTRILSPTGSIDLHRSFTTTDSPLSFSGQTQGMGMGLGTGTMGTPILQRSFSSDSGLSVNSMHGGPHFQSREPEPDKNLALKYRAFPDAYLTKEKEHGKLNPRPGKMYIFDRPGMCGQRTEVRSDVVDATSWDLQETISINVIRGGWVLYEKPNFKGEKIALDEGELELTYPFSIPEEGQQQQQNGQQQNGETSHEQTETKPAKKFIIGSIRRAVRDYSVPEISLFPEENAEGKKVVFRDTCDDARIYGLPIKANSIIINAGLWLVFAEPFFQGLPRVLEVGGYTNPAAWGVEQPYVGSLVPLKVGEPKVENISEPKMVIYDKPYFSGKPRTITTNMRDFITRVDRQQTVFMHNVGSLKVLGGIWVGYEKEGFRGRQYLLEEGEYHDWRVWGGCDSELRSVRVIRADLTDPLMVMFEQPEEDGDGVEEKTFEVTEAIPDVELFQYKTSTRSIQVVSGAWIAYSHVDFSGNQYILEKGFYNNCADWGSQDTRICSVQPILMAPSVKANNEIILYSEPDFQGECHFYDRNQDTVQQKFLTKSCRVVGVSWVAYENEHYTGNMYVLSSGDYPNLTSMGCPNNCPIRSLKVIPVAFSIPSISLFGLEGLEGREITAETEIFSMAEVGYDNHILSVRVNSGCWVICEYSNYRGRQFLLEPIEIPNWPKFSSLQTIGSMYPVRQKRQYFRIKNKERGHFMSVQGGVEEMKSGRVVVTETVEPMSDTWYYEDGLIKNKLSPSMSLQVMGNIEPAAKVVLWTETREPTQTWTFKMRGLITSLTFPGIVIDVKGGKVYDKDHVVIMQENDERPSQQWEIELL